MYGNCSGAQQILQPQLRRVHVEVVREAVDEPLDEVHRLGDAERARVGDTAGCLVGVHGGHVAVGGLDVVAAGEHPPEESGRVLHRCRGAVEGAVVGEDLRADRQDPAVVRGGDFPDHHVVTGEPGADQVFAAILHPLDGFAGQQRRDDRAHVSR